MIEYSTKKRVYRMNFRINQAKSAHWAVIMKEFRRWLRLASWGIGGLKYLGQDEEDYQGEMKAT